MEKRDWIPIGMITFFIILFILGGIYNTGRPPPLMVKPTPEPVPGAVDHTSNDEAL